MVGRAGLLRNKVLVRNLLNESENDTQDINGLLNRRYFSRVWVIQELVLAKSLVIPLYETDYHADSTCIERLNIDWNDTKASWFQHGAGGRVFLRDQLEELLAKMGFRIKECKLDFCKPPSHSSKKACSQIQRQFRC